MSINDYKRFYWLRLKKDFFQQHEIKVLKAMPNGRLYALIYLELLAESTTHNGELRFSKDLPYDITTLASVIDEDKDVLKSAVETLERLELVEIHEDKTIYMNAIQKLIGSETGSAERKREYRKQLKAPEEVKKISRFIPPTIEEVKAYCKERNNGIDAERFANFYSAKGWFIGKNKVKDWKACVRTWEQRNKREEIVPTYNTEDEITFDKEELERLLKERGKNVNTKNN